MSFVPEFLEFRESVNKIGNKRDALLIKTKYLTATRTSEIITSVCPSDRKTTTKVYGTFLKWKLDDFENEKALVLKLAIAKRKEKELVFKSIGLPCNPKYEPWTLDLVRRIKETGNVTFGLTRQRVRQIVKKYFPYPKEISRKYKNPLRHFRLTHLADPYGLTGDEIIRYAGWTFKSRYGVGQLDTYLHLGWREYFHKLLKRIG